ncbi:hypothetical protein B1806_01095 [Metallibacterium scheffleri]|uniref:Uncharacterized protein n=1 Tax=Metallibacterium scheffleri TaxID=993689 RepID=A0A4S3KT54_9GAMM|nr:hypothetical protein B1806_01095 [Metallibacterium scheffleri]
MAYLSSFVARLRGCSTHATDLLATPATARDKHPLVIPSALVILSAAEDLGAWSCARVHADITQSSTPRCFACRLSMTNT